MDSKNVPVLRFYQCSSWEACRLRRHFVALDLQVSTQLTKEVCDGLFRPEKRVPPALSRVHKHVSSMFGVTSHFLRIVLQLVLPGSLRASQSEETLLQLPYHCAFALVQ